ncbi:MAG: allantoicase [Actinomycetota bacterium]|nr:allantoicase [Actinomycetota bacterium]
MSQDHVRRPSAPFAAMPDLASRRLGGSVVAASNELFAERENLIKAESPVFTPSTFGHKGQVYDGWETRRRREPGNDWALVRLGIPGAIRGVIVDTAFFTGNYPPEVSIEAAGVAGYPSPEELLGADWTTIVARTPVNGDSLNEFAVQVLGRFTHVRLVMYPDGGIARLRVHGEPVPDPRILAGTDLDLAALANGGWITGCSNTFYSSPFNLIAPGSPRAMGEGWETARRRDDGNDWVEIRLCGPSVLHRAEIDTSYFLGNAPGWAALSGWHAADGHAAPVELMPRTRLQPDIVHMLPVNPHAEVTHVRVDIFPDGGLARVRLHGTLASAAREQVALRWFNLIPADEAITVLRDTLGADFDPAAAAALIALRPLSNLDTLPLALKAQMETQGVGPSGSVEHHL